MGLRLPQGLDKAGFVPNKTLNTLASRSWVFMSLSSHSTGGNSPVRRAAPCPVHLQGRPWHRRPPQAISVVRVALLPGTVPRVSLSREPGDVGGLEDEAWPTCQMSQSWSVGCPRQEPFCPLVSALSVLHDGPVTAVPTAHGAVPGESPTWDQLLAPGRASMP